MGGSLKLLRVWEIDIQVHWTFLLILAYGAFVFGGGASNPLVGALYGILLILLLFVCVVLHELGHALTAQYYDVNVPYITLLPIGGVAQLERMPRRPMQEFLIAIAGPAVNFALAIILLPLAILTVGISMRTGNITNLGDVMSMTQRPGLGNLLLTLTSINVALGVFNLLPAFPMDGGRVLRALTAMRTSYVRATRLAVVVGRGMALIFAIFGIATFNIILLLIAFFVYIGGRGELEAVESRYVLKDLNARQALNPGAKQIYTSERIDKVVDLIMTTYQADFPVFDLSHNYVGVITRQRLVSALKEGDAEQRVADVMLPASDVPTISPDISLADVWDHMMEKHSRVVSVKQAGRFLGLITLDDISEVIQVMGAAKQEETEADEPAPMWQAEAESEDETVVAGGEAASSYNPTGSEAEVASTDEETPAPNAKQT